MRQTKQRRAVAIAIHKRVSASMDDLLQDTESVLKYGRTDLRRIIIGMENNGECLVTKKKVNVSYHILSVSLSQLGIDRWILSKRDDLKPMLPKGKPGRKKGSKYGPYNKRSSDSSSSISSASEQLFEQHSERELPPIMPCMQRIARCEHGSCYLREKCSAHPQHL